MHSALLFFVFLTFCYGDGFYEGDSIIEAGVRAFYNYRFDESVEILTEAREKYPNHPGVHMIWAASRWVRAKALYSTERSNQVLEADLKTIQPIYDNLSKKYNYDPNYKLYKGSSIGLSARVTLGKKQWIKTFYRAYLGFSIIDDLYENNSQNADINLPIGIVEYYSGISNKFIKFILKAYGFDPSIDSGLNKIESAAEDGNWSWIEAKGILCYLYLWIEDNPIMAYKHSENLVEHFPNNFYFNILNLESLIRNGKKDQALKKIKQLDKMLFKLTPRQKEWYLPYFNYEKALHYFYQKNYKKAIDFLNLTIESYSAELDIILGNAILLRGMAYDMTNQRIKAKINYRTCLKLDNLSLAMDKARIYLEKPFQGN